VDLKVDYRVLKPPATLSCQITSFHTLSSDVDQILLISFYSVRLGVPKFFLHIFQPKLCMRFPSVLCLQHVTPIWSYTKHKIKIFKNVDYIHHNQISKRSNFYLLAFVFIGRRKKSINNNSVDECLRYTYHTVTCFPQDRRIQHGDLAYAMMCPVISSLL
jgi:hypothetical protein